MSIINDALKKTQLSFKKKDKPAEAKQEPPVEQEPKNVYEKFYKKQQDLQNASAAARESKGKSADAKENRLRSAKKWLKTSAVVIVCLLVVCGGFFLLSRYKPAKDFYRSLAKSKTPSRAYIPRQAPKKRTYRPGELVLNGTSLIDGKRVALINDEIYEVGEVINGKKITSIDMNKIELRDNEKIITLRVH